MHGVGLDCRRRLGVTVTALIRRDGAKPGVGQSMQLVAPGIPDLRKSVTQQYRKTAARLDDMHLDAVGVDLPVSELGHAGCHWLLVTGYWLLVTVTDH